MALDFNKISQNKRYGYAKVSSREQAENSSLESQKAELMKLCVFEENIYLEIGSATDAIENRPVFFKLIKQRAIQWKKFPNPVFSRLDIVYQRISKSTDPISTIDFINSCYIQFQELHSSKNLLSERNQKGLILKIGNRRSSKHYRIYTNKKNNLLRFEAEMKGDLIKDFQNLLITSSFE